VLTDELAEAIANARAIAISAFGDSILVVVMDLRALRRQFACRAVRPVEEPNLFDRANADSKRSTSTEAPLRNAKLRPVGFATVTCGANLHHCRA
jgi:hypothetical protein